MLPRREEFILDVRRAARAEQRPLVTTDSELVNADVISKAIRRASLWLTPKVVEAYDPADFSNAPEEKQKALRDAVLSEWTAAVEGLVGSVERWSEESGWKARREPKPLTETLLGDYSLPQLEIYAGRHLYVLSPLARFVPAALGAFELSVQPSFFVKSIYRDPDANWRVQFDATGKLNGAGEAALSRESFARALDELRSAV